MGFVPFKQFNMSLKVYQLTVKDLYFLFLRLFSVVIRKLLVLSTSKHSVIVNDSFPHSGPLAPLVS